METVHCDEYLFATGLFLVEFDARMSGDFYIYR